MTFNEICRRWDNKLKDYAGKKMSIDKRNSKKQDNETKAGIGVFKPPE